MSEIVSEHQNPEQSSSLESSQDTEEILSQQDYIPTPFEESSFEVVGEEVKERDFCALEVEIVPQETAQVDPMFQQFDDSRPESPSKLWHLPEEFAYTGETKEEEEEVNHQEILEEHGKQQYQEGHTAGYQEGYSAAEESVAARYEDLSNQISELGKKISTGADEYFGRLERESIKLSLEVAKKILQITAEVKPDYILDVIRQGLKSLGGSKPLKIRLSPQDFEFLEVVGVPLELSSEELGVEYVADEEIVFGCLIETDFGKADLQIDSMWEQIRQKLEELYK